MNEATTASPTLPIAGTPHQPEAPIGASLTPEKNVSIHNTIADMASALSAARDEMDEVAEQIAGLEARRRQLVNHPPHVDDIVATLQRGISNTARMYEQQFGAYLNADAVMGHNAGGGAALPGLLTLRPNGVVDGRFLPSTGELNMAALTYFLHDEMVAKIPALVSKLAPHAQTNLRSEEKADLIAQVDAALIPLREKHAELHEGINSAKGAIHNAVARGPLSAHTVGSTGA